jgi:hypothetical protein
MAREGGRRPRVPDDFWWMGAQAAGDLDGFPDSVRWPPTMGRAVCKMGSRQARAGRTASSALHHLATQLGHLGRRQPSSD